MWKLSTVAIEPFSVHAYFPLRRLLTKTDRNGNYDALGCVIGIATTYTLTGQVRTEENNWQKTTYTYDELGNGEKVVLDHFVKRG